MLGTNSRCQFYTPEVLSTLLSVRSTVGQRRPVAALNNPNPAHDGTQERIVHMVMRCAGKHQALTLTRRLHSV
jgi:hypothetical protein